MTGGAWAVEVTDAAYSDLWEAASYMRDVLRSPKAAKDFVLSFEARVDDLRTFPEGRPLVRDYELAQKGYRWSPIGSFMLFYTVDRDGRKVVVERVLYGARDWKSLLTEDDE